MIFILIVLCVMVVVLYEHKTQGSDTKLFNNIIEDKNMPIRHAYGYYISALTGEKLGMRTAKNGDLIFYGLSSKNVVFNASEYKILLKRIEAKTKNYEFIYFYNNRYYYKINVETGIRTILNEHRRKHCNKIAVAENPIDYINYEYWKNPIVSNRKYFVSNLLGINSPYEIEEK